MSTDYWLTKLPQNLPIQYEYRNFKRKGIKIEHLITPDVRGNKEKYLAFGKSYDLDTVIEKTMTITSPPRRPFNYVLLNMTDDNNTFGLLIAEPWIQLIKAILLNQNFGLDVDAVNEMILQCSHKDRWTKLFEWTRHILPSDVSTLIFIKQRSNFNSFFTNDTTVNEDDDNIMVVEMDRINYTLKPTYFELCRLLIIKNRQRGKKIVIYNCCNDRCDCEYIYMLADKTNSKVTTKGSY